MRLTIAQARNVYRRMVDPGNRANDAVNTDMTDAAPLTQFRADVAALIAADRSLPGELRSVRWPARVQPYVDAMILTDIPDSMRCLTAVARAPSYSDAQTVFDTDQPCVASDASANPNQIRTVLGLPPRS